MTIDIKKLVTAFNEMKQEEPAKTQISEYLKLAVVQPLLHGKKVCISDICLNNFEQQDIEDLKEYLLEKSSMCDRTERFCRTVSRILPKYNVDLNFC